MDAELRAQERAQQEMLNPPLLLLNAPGNPHANREHVQPLRALSRWSRAAVGGIFFVWFLVLLLLPLSALPGVMLLFPTMLLFRSDKIAIS